MIGASLSWDYDTRIWYHLVHKLTLAFENEAKAFSSPDIKIMDELFDILEVLNSSRL